MRDAAHFENWYPPALEMTRFEEPYTAAEDLQFYGVYYNVDAYGGSRTGAPETD